MLSCLGKSSPNITKRISDHTLNSSAARDLINFSNLCSSLSSGQVPRQGPCSTSDYLITLSEHASTAAYNTNEDRVSTYVRVHITVPLRTNAPESAQHTRWSEAQAGQKVSHSQKCTEIDLSTRVHAVLTEMLRQKSCYTCAVPSRVPAATCCTRYHMYDVAKVLSLDGFNHG